LVRHFEIGLRLENLVERLEVGNRSLLHQTIALGLCFVAKEAVTNIKALIAEQRLRFFILVEVTHVSQLGQGKLFILGGILV